MIPHRATAARHVLRLVLGRRQLLEPSVRRFATAAAATTTDSDNSTSSLYPPVAEDRVRGAPSPLGFYPSVKLPNNGQQTGYDPTIQPHLDGAHIQSSLSAPQPPPLPPSSPSSVPISPAECQQCSPSHQFAAALTVDPRVTVARVRHLLVLPVGDTVAAKQARLADLRKLINHLSSALHERRTKNIRRVLLATWGHWLQLAGQLQSLAALPRPGGNEGREMAPKWFDSLLQALIDSETPNTTSTIHHTPAQAEASMVARFGISRPTISSALGSMVNLGCPPTPFQLQRLLQHKPVSEILGWAAGHPVDHTALDGNAALDDAARVLSSLLTTLSPESIAGRVRLAGSPHRRGASKHSSADLRRLELEACNQALSTIERIQRRKLEPLPQWYAFADERRPTWTAYISNYVERAAAIANGTSDARAAFPTKSEAFILWLLLRDLLIQADRVHHLQHPVAATSGASLPGTPRPGATTLDGPTQPYDITKPLDIIRLSCGITTLKPEEPTMSGSHWQDRRYRFLTVSTIIRYLHWTMRESWTAVDELSSFMLRSTRREDFPCGENPNAWTQPIPPITVMTASYMLGATRTPAHLEQMLPRLEGIPIVEGGFISRTVRERRLLLAALADRSNAETTSNAADRSENNLEHRLQLLLDRLDQLGDK